MYQRKKPVKQERCICRSEDETASEEDAASSSLNRPLLRPDRSRTHRCIKTSAQTSASSESEREREREVVVRVGAERRALPKGVKWVMTDLGLDTTLQSPT